MSTSPVVDVTNEEIDAEAGMALLERRARRSLNIGAAEFIEAWDRDKASEFDHVSVMELAILLPLAR